MERTVPTTSSTNHARLVERIDKTRHIARSDLHVRHQKLTTASRSSRHTAEAHDTPLRSAPENFPSMGARTQKKLMRTDLNQPTLHISGGGSARFWPEPCTPLSVLWVDQWTTPAVHLRFLDFAMVSSWTLRVQFWKMQLGTSGYSFGKYNLDPQVAVLEMASFV